MFERSLWLRGPRLRNGTVTGFKHSPNPYNHLIVFRGLMMTSAASRYRSVRASRTS